MELLSVHSAFAGANAKAALICAAKAACGFISEFFGNVADAVFAEFLLRKLKAPVPHKAHNAFAGAFLKKAAEMIYGIPRVCRDYIRRKLFIKVFFNIFYAFVYNFSVIHI